ncbi:MAG: MauE/DoxX family redox-associated membrane protein [Candidatus Binataceae bacterium]
MRLLSGGVLCLYGAAKLTRMPSAASSMWRPVWVDRRVMTILVICASTAEALLGLSLAFGIMPALIAIFILAAFLITVSAYGSMALNRGASCGCSGENEKKRITRNRSGAQRLLWARNTTLFILASLGIALAPSINSLVGEPQTLIPCVAGIPIASLLILLTVRFGRDRWNAKPSAGRAALYRRLLYYA